MSDVCFIVEGSYPYIRGGVSEWVNKLITSMPDLQFSVLSIMPSPSYTREEHYQIPNNVESIVNVYLHDYHFKERFFKQRTPELFEFFDLFYGGIDKRPKEELERLLLKLMNNRGKIDLSYAFSSRDLWRSLLKSYNSGDTSTTFLDFFWNYRFTFLPIVQLLRTNIPPAPLYHAVSTGYAGVLASLAKIKFNSNLLLTEHGIYTKERRIEIAQATWIYESKEESMRATSSLGFFKNWWIRYFGAMSNLTYTYADQITTLYEGNKLSQISDGADPKKIAIIPTTSHALLLIASTAFKLLPPVEIRFLPEKVLTPAVFLIYKDKVIINMAKEMTFFVLKSKTTHEAFEAYFQILWGNAKD